MGRIMVNLTDPNSYPPGGRTWAVAFIGTAGDLPLMTANEEGLFPEPSPVLRIFGDSDNNYLDRDTTPSWPVDSGGVSVWETQRGESAAEAGVKGGGRASGTADVSFDVDGEGVMSYTATIDVDASPSDVQAALRMLGGLLEEVEISLDDGTNRARNGGDRG